MAIKHQTTNITVVKHQGTTLTTVYHQGTKVFPDQTYEELEITIDIWLGKVYVTVYNPNSFDIYFDCNVYIQTTSGEVEFTVTDQDLQSGQSRSDMIYEPQSAEVEYVYLDYTISGGGYTWHQEAEM